MTYTLSQLQTMDQQQLCDLLQEKLISWSEYIDAQPDLYGGYDAWLSAQGRERSDESAHLFIAQTESADMLSQTGDSLDAALDTCRQARQVLGSH